MATVETITLVIAIFWALWQLLSLRDAAINGEGVFPAMIPSFFLFVGAIATVLLLHLSPLHLIWLAVVCNRAKTPRALEPEANSSAQGIAFNMDKEAFLLAVRDVVEARQPVQASSTSDNVRQAMAQKDLLTLS